MSKNWTIPIVIVLVVLFVLAVAYIDDKNAINSGEEMTFNVSSGHSDLNGVINNIKTLPYYKGYDAETVKWMESLGDKQVFSGNNRVVIMDPFDARKIPQDPGITDVYIYDYFTARVVESHDLGYGLPTVYYVKDVNFINQEIIGTGLA